MLLINRVDNMSGMRGLVPAVVAVVAGVFGGKSTLQQASDQVSQGADTGYYTFQPEIQRLEAEKKTKLQSVLPLSVHVKLCRMRSISALTSFNQVESLTDMLVTEKRHGLMPEITNRIYHLTQSLTLLLGTPLPLSLRQSPPSPSIRHPLLLPGISRGFRSSRLAVLVANTQSFSAKVHA